MLHAIVKILDQGQGPVRLMSGRQPSQEVVNERLGLASAGSQFGDSLTVMSKGTRFTQQSYKVSDIFPFEWIKKKWREGFHISAMATGGHPNRPPVVSPPAAVCPWQWAIVMSRTTGWADQV